MPSKPRKSCQLRHRPCPELLLSAPKSLHPLTSPAEAMRAVRGRYATDGMRFASQICSGAKGFRHVAISHVGAVASVGSEHDTVAPV